MFQLNCKTQKYAWGKRGSTSAVALLASKGAGLSVDESENYAEFWFGTHKNGPSDIAVGSQGASGFVIKAMVELSLPCMHCTIWNSFPLLSTNSF